MPTLPPDQFAQLLSVLASPKVYTLTGAADWPMLVAVCGLFWAIIVALGGVMWFDLRNSLSAGEQRWQKAVDAHALELDKKCRENKEQLDKHEARDDVRFAEAHNAIKECRADCCPRMKGDQHG